MTLPERLAHWTKEPLVHFLIAGAAVYALFAWRGEPADPASRTIELSREDKAQLSLGFERLMGRAPSDAELDRQVHRFIREEVLYREALRLGLDGNDAVVRRRMAQKMDMLAAAQAETAQPSDKTLQEWYEANPDRFADTARYTLDQVYHTERAGAEALVARLNGESNAGDFAKLGAAISLPTTVREMNRKEVLERFGQQFLAGIDALNQGETWHGPLQSGFGWHAVRLNAREVGAVPPFEDVRTSVENDWRTSTIAARKERGYAILRDAYSIEIAD